MEPRGTITTDTDTAEITKQLEGVEPQDGLVNPYKYYAELPSEKILAASRRIYMYEWVSDYFIGTDVQNSNILALSFVVSGIKAMSLLMLLVLWNLVWLILVGTFNFFYSIFTL